jgi:hypothetical protein
MMRDVLSAMAACLCLTFPYAAFALQSDPGAGGTSGSSGPRHFTKAEGDVLTPCFVASIKVVDIADAKSRGVDINTMKSHGPKDDYDGLALVDRVYHDQFDDPWMYSINDYRGCASNHADLSNAAVFVSQLCVIDGYTANFAYHAKTSGWKKDQVFAQLKAFEKTPESTARIQAVVDGVYASNASLGADVVGAWGRCMTNTLVK